MCPLVSTNVTKGVYNYEANGQDEWLVPWAFMDLGDGSQAAMSEMAFQKKCVGRLLPEQWLDLDSLVGGVNVFFCKTRLVLPGVD